MSTDEKKLNPEIKEVLYGKKELKQLILYPLSISDQFKVTDMITEIVQQLVEGQKSGQTTDYAFMTAAISALQKNIDKVLSIVADISVEETTKIVDVLTNTQLVNIVDVIWTVNYEPALKKGKSLFERGKSVFASKKLSQISSSVIPNTDLKTSIEKPIKEEE